MIFFSCADICVDVIGRHALRISAKFAAKGKFTEARVGAIVAHKLLNRSW